MSRRQQYYAETNDAAALVRAYSYLIRQDCRWLAGLPGIDRQRLKATHAAQQRGEVWHVADMIEMSRKPILAFPATTPQQVAA